MSHVPRPGTCATADTSVPALRPSSFFTLRTSGRGFPTVASEGRQDLGDVITVHVRVLEEHLLDNAVPVLRAPAGIHWRRAATEDR